MTKSKSPSPTPHPSDNSTSTSQATISARLPALSFPPVRNNHAYALRSRTPPTSASPIKQESDGTLACWFNAPGHRSILPSPNNAGQTMVTLNVMGTSEKLQNHAKVSRAEQDELMHKIFADAGWEAPPVLAGMDEADEF
ncbi:MAG: hypothetical protein Q9161_002358 [Pseudevernia consocians]